MVTYRLFRDPRRGGLTSHVATGSAEVGLYEDGRPLARLWAARHDGGRLVEDVASVDVLWPANKGLPPLPPELEGLPRAVLTRRGYFGGNEVALPDGRRFSLPLATGGYLSAVEGALGEATP